MAKKKRYRKIKRPSSGRKPYFTKDTQKAIIAFCESTCYDTRSELYNEHIKNALEKLSENLIFVYGFHKQHDDVANLKHSCVVNLYENLHKFDHTRGSNAFSYFNVVAKNWLIIQSRIKNKRKSRLVYMEDQNDLSNTDKTAIENWSISPSPSTGIEVEEKHSGIKKLLLEIKNKAKNDMEKKCCDAICQIFDNIDSLDYLNKRAVFVYVRNISGLNSKQLSVCMSTIRRNYRELCGPNKKFDIF
mgnify:CR=1 FL=1|jgi:hypothetical protein